MTVEGKKISGNAQYIKEGRVMHHGTILYDSDLGMLSGALKPGEDKIESKGIKSVQSRVTNIRPYMKNDVPIAEFWAALKNYICSDLGMLELTLTSEQKAEVEKLASNVYSKWSWNYGSSPPHTMRRLRRIESCGKIEVLIDIGQEGIIKNVTFYGDFFGKRDCAELADMLLGHHLEWEEIKTVLEGIDISLFFYGLDKENFISLLF